MIDTITWLEKGLQYWTSEIVITDKVIADARKVIQFGEVVQRSRANVGVMSV